MALWSAYSILVGASIVVGDDWALPLDRSRAASCPPASCSLCLLGGVVRQHIDRRTVVVGDGLLFGLVLYADGIHHALVLFGPSFFAVGASGLGDQSA